MSASMAKQGPGAPGESVVWGEVEIWAEPSAGSIRSDQRRATREVRYDDSTGLEDPLGLSDRRERTRPET